MRPSWDEYFLNIAQAVSKRSTCIRRQYGAVIVKNKRIISTGYNGNPCGEDNCDELGWCLREKTNAPHGSDYSNCTAVHAEMNAIINGEPSEMIDADIYICGRDENGLVDSTPCYLCKRMIINAKLRRVIYIAPSGMVSYLVNPKKNHIYYKIRVQIGDINKYITTSAASNEWVTKLLH